MRIAPPLLVVATLSLAACSGGSGGAASPPSFQIPAECHGSAGSGGGTAQGPGVVATVCTNQEIDLHTFGSRNQLMFSLSAGTSKFQSPKGGSLAELFGSIGIPAAKAGTYSSSDAGACGSLTFVYALASPPGLDCHPTVTPDSPSACPAGCSTECSGLGCEPCRPAPPQVGYGAAEGTFDCDGNSQGPAAGSWTLALTSVKETTDGPAQTSYAVHGTLALTLAGSTNSGGSAGSGHVQIALSF